MDKITHQVRVEHWAKIMNECINSGMSKTAWCRANGISEKQFFYWKRIHMKRTFSSSSVADAVTVSRDLYGKATDSCSFTKGWSLAVSAGLVQRKKHWRSHRNNTRR